MSDPITVRTVVDAPLGKVWEYWTEPEHITKWAFASDDWEAPSAQNDVRTGGKFKTRMQAKGKSEGFDFTGVYTNVNGHELIEYDMDDPEGNASRSEGAGARHVKVVFEETPKGVKVTETFDPESENSQEVQREGWQAILDNFKKYVEGNH